MLKTLTTDFELDLEADVLVIGGGPAGTWAAWSAASNGAKVVLVDKGYCGTTGCAAASGNGVWYVPPDPEARETAKASRESLGGFLRSQLDGSSTGSDLCKRQSVSRVGLSLPYPTMKANPTGDHCRAEYMRLMRRQIQRAESRFR